MALQSSGAISLNDIATEFGGTTPHAISEYYRDGGLVPSNNTTVPTSGAIDFADFYDTVSAIVLNITSNTSEYNILTQATAAGYNAATDSTPIQVNVQSSATVSGSSTYAMRTGALNNNSDLTITVDSGSSITGYTGANGGSHGAGGSAGGDGIYVETNTGGSGTLSVVNNGTVSGGGGGGGHGGQSGIRQNLVYDDGCKCDTCDGSYIYGSDGSNGSAGGLGQAGGGGGSGSYGGGSASCNIRNPSGGGPGGAAGYAVRKNSRTVGTSGSGTFNGTAG